MHLPVVQSTTGKCNHDVGEGPSCGDDEQEQLVSIKTVQARGDFSLYIFYVFTTADLTFVFWVKVKENSFKAAQVFAQGGGEFVKRLYSTKYYDYVKSHP